MNTTEAMKGSEEIILSHFGLPPITGNKHFKGECPLCARKGKFRLSRYNGGVSYICSCGNGNIVNLIEQVTGQDFKDIAAQIDKLIGHSFKAEKQERPKDIPHETALKNFKGYAGIKGTPAQEYLNSRGIFSLPPKGVRYCGHTGMMALVTDDRFIPCYWHKTFLKGSTKTNRQLEGLQDRKQLEHCGSVAIRMYPVASTMGISEGLETALAARQIYQCNVWSVVNTSFMKRFKAPKGVDHLIVFADNDPKGAGHAAAFECAHKNMVAKNDVVKVSVRWPGEACDFNDMLVSGSNVYEWILQ
jgi:putative DNA primase/helicase